jgi:hypothetical protein
MKFSKPFKGVKAGEIYPTDFEPGDECPPELEQAARASEVLETEQEPAPKRRTTKSQ